MPSELPSSRPPRLSVVWTGKNCASSIEAAIGSILALDEPDFEIVVEDGGSTDGTLELLQRHAGADARIVIVSRPDASANQRLLNGLRRCRGDIVAICPEAGRFLPDAMTTALEELRRIPDADALLCGERGAFDIVSLLFSREQPELGNVLLRRRCLLDFGLEGMDWAVDCVDFDILRRLAAEGELRRSALTIAVPGPPFEYARRSVEEVRRHLAARLDLVDRLFAGLGSPAGTDDTLRLECAANQLSVIQERCSQLSWLARARIFRPRTRALAAELERLRGTFPRLLHFRQIDFPVQEKATRRLGGRFAAQLEALDRLSRKFGIETDLFVAPTPLERLLRARLKTARELPTADLRRALADRYRHAALALEGRGQVSEALWMWRHTEALQDIVVDSLALQTLTKCPETTDLDIGRMQSRWVARHAPQAKDPEAPSARPYDGRRKIRIAYHCSFMDGDTMRHMMKRVIAAHDRTGFEVYGYSPVGMPDDLKPSFDVVRDIQVTGSYPQAVRIGDRSAISDDRFAELVRSDAIDVFVELSGFSPGHRLAVLARRCAPVQILYINHASTSMVPNVDGFVSDGIANPVDDRATFSEELIRLPHCLFCYDYRDTDYPAIVDPPSLARGFVTFGCFGTGQKFNISLIRRWAQVLDRVPNSVLRLQNSQMKSADTRRFIRSRFARFGIAPERILAVPGTDRQTLLGCYSEIDISLDTWPYNGGSTIAESLWHGVPVVGLYGTSFASRYGASLLEAAGCRDLVGKSPEEYVDIAAALANDPEHLRSLRHRLRDMCGQHGLNDSTRMARSLETVFRTLMGRIQSGRA
jgi:predicted O-linked N-acetylglucosamine transferase (SPINDLY family)